MCIKWSMYCHWASCYGSFIVCSLLSITHTKQRTMLFQFFPWHSERLFLPACFVAVMGVSRVLSGSYMWYAYKEIDCKPLIGNFNHAGYAVLGAHAVHLLLLGDFAYFYLKNVTKSGLRAPLDLSESWSI